MRHCDSYAIVVQRAHTGVSQADFEAIVQAALEQVQHMVQVKRIRVYLDDRYDDEVEALQSMEADYEHDEALERDTALAEWLKRVDDLCLVAFAIRHTDLVGDWNYGETFDSGASPMEGFYVLLSTWSAENGIDTLEEEGRQVTAEEFAGTSERYIRKGHAR